MAVLDGDDLASGVRFDRKPLDGVPDHGGLRLDADHADPLVRFQQDVGDEGPLLRREPQQADDVGCRVGDPVGGGCHLKETGELPGVLLGPAGQERLVADGEFEVIHVVLQVADLLGHVVAVVHQRGVGEIDDDLGGVFHFGE